MIWHFRCFPRLFIYNTCRTSDGSANACLEQGWVYIMMGRSDPTVTSQSVLCSDSPVFQCSFFKSRDLHEEETMVSEAHCMSFPCTELLLFNYAKVKTVFHSMAPLILPLHLILAEMTCFAFKMTTQCVKTQAAWLLQHHLTRFS